MKDFKHAIWAVIIADIVIMKYAWNIYFYHPDQLGIGGRLHGYGNYNLSNDVGLLLTITFPLVFFLMEAQKNTLERLLLIAFLAASFITVAYTKSRGALIGFSTVITLCVIFSRHVFRSKPVKTFTLILLGVGVLGYALPIVFTRFTGNSKLDWSLDQRRMAWHAAIKMFESYPILGVGWNNFTDYCRQFGMTQVLVAHNTLLSVLAETGILGIFFYVSYTVVTFKELFVVLRGIKASVEYEHLYQLTCGVVISLIGFTINTMVSVKESDPTLWFLLGFGGAICAAYKRITAAEGEGVEPVSEEHGFEQYPR